jgi:hypothetical protein
MFKQKNVKSITAGLQATLDNLNTYAEEQKAVQVSLEAKLEATRMECTAAKTIATNLGTLLGTSSAQEQPLTKPGKSK